MPVKKNLLLSHYGQLSTVLGCGNNNGLESGCTELDESVLTEWDHAQLCVRACRKLGNVEPAIWAVSQLRGSQSQWLDITELRHRRCHLTSAEYAALVLWLPSCRLLPPSRRGEPPQEPAEGVGTTMTNLDSIPPCIAGTVIDTRGHDQVVLRSLPPRGVTEVAVSKTSDLTLAALLCHHRAIFPLPVNDHEARPVECLTPLRRVIHHYPFQQEYIIVRLPHAPEHPVAVLSLALVRDCLLGDGRESLYEACGRPQWVVDKADFMPGSRQLPVLTVIPPRGSCSIGRVMANLSSLA